MTTTAGAVTPRMATDRELADRGHPKVRRDEWAMLLDEGAYWVAAQDSVDLADRVEAWRRASTPTDGKIPAPRWLWAKSLLLAADASRDDDVADFRRLHLIDGLIDLGDVESWIKARQGEGMRRPPADTFLPDPVLEYPAGGLTLSLLVGFDGVLSELRSLSFDLAKQYPWEPAQATAFVLTGATPVSTAIRATSGERRGTITMEIDPEMSVDDVARAYARVRRAQLGPKPRPIAERTVDLVVSRGTDAEAADHVLYGRWNRENPDRQFASIRAFRQALRDGTRRLIAGPRPRR